MNDLLRIKLGPFCIFRLNEPLRFSLKSLSACTCHRLSRTLSELDNLRCWGSFLSFLPMEFGSLQHTLLGWKNWLSPSPPARKEDQSPKTEEFLSLSMC